MDYRSHTHVWFKPIYNENLSPNEYLSFKFLVSYQNYSNHETQTVSIASLCQKQWLFGGDRNHLEGIVYNFLDFMFIPWYSDVVWMLTCEIWRLKEYYPLNNLEKVEIEINVFVNRFPDDVIDVDVQLAVAPASDEAVEAHLETVVVKTEGYCVICMDKILVGSDVEAVRMPCKHEFHRTCGVEWLRNSGICPVCRSVLPS